MTKIRGHRGAYDYAPEDLRFVYEHKLDGVFTNDIRIATKEREKHGL